MTPHSQTEPNRNMRNSNFETGPSGSPRSRGMVAPASLETRHRQKRAAPTRGPLLLRPIATTLQSTPWLPLCEQPYLQRTNRNNSSSLGSNCVSNHMISAKDTRNMITTPWLPLCEQPYLQRTNRNNSSSLGSNCVSNHMISAKDLID